MAINHTNLSPDALAQVAQIRADANMWASLNPFGKTTDAAPKAESTMSPEELQAKLAGEKLDDPNRAPDKNVEPGIEAELYEQHMRTMAADMGVDLAGMNNIDEITDAVQAAVDNPELAQATVGDNYLATALGGDIAAKDMSISDMEATGPTATPDARTIDPNQLGA